MSPSRPAQKKRRAQTTRVARSGTRDATISFEDREKLVVTALDLIEQVYVHLPLKRAMHAINPLQRLKLLRRRLSPPNPPSDREFLSELLVIFCHLRDLHTNFVLPEPFRSSTAYLPFRLEECFEGSKRIYVVSQLLTGGPLPSGFERGSIVTHWNGVPIDRAVALNADREAGSNPAARHAQGLAALTLRWMGQSLPPDEEWVAVRYLPPSSPSKAKDCRFEWQVFRQKSAKGHAIASARGEKAFALGMDARGEVERQIRQFLFSGRAPLGPASRHFGEDQGIQSSMPDVFSSTRDVVTPSGTYAYVRIATFNVPDDQEFLEEFVRILGRLSQVGLILDVRGNGGGLIHAGERLLQLLTPRLIDPARFSFLSSGRTESLTEKHDFIRKWNASIKQSVETGTEYSQGFSLLPLAKYNDIGQKYTGPVVLVTDALCYSTTDIFAAGFQDHDIGLILGVHENTGAGGANVWDYSLVSQLADSPAEFPQALPGSASFRVAIRRVTRVGERSGVPLEELGVQPDEIYRMTRRDILERNADLIRRAAQILATLPKQTLVAERVARGRIRVTCQNVDRVDAYSNARPLRSRKVAARRKPEKLNFYGMGGAATSVRFEGFRAGKLVAAARV